MQEEQEIKHELVAKRYYITVDEEIPEILNLNTIPTALPLRNVVDWEQCDPQWHEDAPNENITAVVLPYETKFVEIPFKKFTRIMRQFRKHERNENKWSRFN
tara:strand:+ start:1539 stop:1844 length:306 start_codon:yes stop_codon:yes gene_type:complete